MLQGGRGHSIIQSDLLYITGHYISPSYLCIEPNKLCFAKDYLQKGIHLDVKTLGARESTLLPLPLVCSSD